MVKFASVALGLLFLLPQARAFELRASGGLLQLPASGYHHVAYQFNLGLGRGQALRVSAGVSHPFSRFGYAQWIGNAAVGYEWSRSDSGLRPFAGLGGGFFVDAVGRRLGFVPALNLRGGFKWGGKNLGATLELDSYLGVYSFNQLLAWTLWPMYQFLVGVYVAF